MSSVAVTSISHDCHVGIIDGGLWNIAEVEGVYSSGMILVSSRHTMISYNKPFVIK
jgi:hypothetical protein